LTVSVLGGSSRELDSARLLADSGKRSSLWIWIGLSNRTSHILYKDLHLVKYPWVLLIGVRPALNDSYQSRIMKESSNDRVLYDLRKEPRLVGVPPNRGLQS
jgi:hypothetical protein